MCRFYLGTLQTTHKKATLLFLLCRDPHAGRWRGGRCQALAPGQSQRGLWAAQTPQRQSEGEGRGEGQGHSRNLPHQTALHEGNRKQKELPTEASLFYALTFFSLFEPRALCRSLWMIYSLPFSAPVDPCPWPSNTSLTCWTSRLYSTASPTQRPFTSGRQTGNWSWTAAAVRGDEIAHSDRQWPDDSSLNMV